MSRYDSLEFSAHSLVVENAPVPTLEVDTVLRQWMGMRPEQPPLLVRPWLLLGGAHHASDLPLLHRLGIGYVMNVAWNVRNFHEDQPGLIYKVITSMITSKSSIVFSKRALVHLCDLSCQ